MGSVTISNFEDIDSSLDANENSFEWHVDFGEGGESEIYVDVDSIIESCVISTNTESVTIDTEILAGELVNQGEFESMIRGLCIETSFDEVFDMLVAISPDYKDE